MMNFNVIREGHKFSEAEQAVLDLRENAPDTDHLYNLAGAQADLERLRTEWEYIPNMTPQDLMDIWNTLALAENQDVVLPIGIRVPRWTQMTTEQIAVVIEEAWCWRVVRDLITYVNAEYIHLPQDGWNILADGWQEVVLEWCHEQHQ